MPSRDDLYVPCLSQRPEVATFARADRTICRVCGDRFLQGMTHAELSEAPQRIAAMVVPDAEDEEVRNSVESGDAPEPASYTAMA